MSAKSYTYLGLCPRTHRRYIGVRWANQVPAKDDLGKHYHSSSKLVPDNMLWRVLKEHDTPEEARAHEAELHKRYDVARSDRYFNQCEAGENPKFYFNRPHTEEWKRNHSERMKGKPQRPRSEETKRKNAEAARRKVWTPEAREKVANHFRGRVRSDEELLNISQAKGGTRIRLTNTITGESADYLSLENAGNRTGFPPMSLRYALKKGSLYKKTWSVERI